ncbi:MULTISPECIES: hypothetical protein [Burkholderia]|uniref:hypothetical protein n=1 Tax=Burkholderia TaxID=32008 RepID=UPI0015886AFA|nr:MULTISPECIES: hypothetical protein [Burkholderia]
MLRRLGKFAVVVLSIIGALTVFHLFMRDRFSSLEEPNPDGVRSYTSPDGRYLAELLSWAGGNAFASHCNQVVIVFPASVSREQARRGKRYEVYSGQCDDFADHSPSPKISWRSDRALDVLFSINHTAASARSVTLKKLDFTGNVKIEFTAKE